MTKADLVENVYESLNGFAKKDCAERVDLIFETMKAALANGDKIKLSGFGNFVVREKRERPGRNPQTGEEITISARRVMTFKPSSVLKNILNSG